MRMPEAMPSAEQGAGELVLFSLTKGLGDRTIRDRLDVFQKEGMNGPQAARALFSLFEPLSVTEDDLHLLRTDDKKPETLWDQVGWASAKPQSLTRDQKGALTSLQYFALDSLASTAQTHKLHGEMREFNKETAVAAQSAFEAYGKHLQKVLDPDDPTSAKIFDVSALTAKVAVRISPLVLAAACGLRVAPMAVEIPIAPVVAAHAESINSASTPGPFKTDSAVGYTIPAVSIPSEIANVSTGPEQSAEGHETDPSLLTFEQAFDRSLGDEAVNSGKKGSAYNPPFKGATIDGRYTIAMSLFMVPMPELGGQLGGMVDSVDYPDPNAEIQIAGYYTVKMPDGTWRYRAIDTQKKD